MIENEEQNPLLELFRTELKTNIPAIESNLKILQTGSGAEIKDALSNLISIAHSMKGGAKIVQLESAVNLFSAFELFFVALQKKTIAISTQHFSLLFDAMNILKELAEAEVEQWSGLLNELAARFQIIKEGLQNKVVEEPARIKSQPKPKPAR